MAPEGVVFFFSGRFVDLRALLLGKHPKLRDSTPISAPTPLRSALRSEVSHIRVNRY